jgi:hydrogenase nickel incorporation protein HypA/HybF
MVDVHELSIAVALVDLACEEAANKQLGRVRSLHVRLGRLSGVVKEALVFSFDVASAGTAVAGATLEIEDTPRADLELFALEVVE